MTAYVSPDLVAQALGATFTAAQEAAALDLCGAATAWIDSYTERSWQAAIVTDELHRLVTTDVFLRQVPVVTVASATLETPAITDDATVLVSGTDYRLIDAAIGWLRTNGVFGDVLRVSYTAQGLVPASVQQAAIGLVAVGLTPTLAADSLGGAISRISLAAGDVEVSYANWRQTGVVPQSVKDWLAPYRRRPIVVA
jgi:hypothetical protein